MENGLKRFLLIDDDETNNFINSVLIKKSGIAEDVNVFTIATDAMDFLKNAGDQFPDVILVDIRIPVFDGWDFLNAYYENGFDKKGSVVAMLSTSVFEEDELKAKSFSKRIDFISKPLTAEHLKSIMDFSKS